MNKDRILPLSLFCLSAALIISAVIISNGIKNGSYGLNSIGAQISQGLSSIGFSISNSSSANKGNTNSIFTSSTNNNGSNTNAGAAGNSMTLYAAADYIGISTSNLIKIMDSADSKIPFIHIDNDYIFNKAALDKWLETARIELK